MAHIEAGSYNEAAPFDEAAIDEFITRLEGLDAEGQQAVFRTINGDKSALPGQLERFDAEARIASGFKPATLREVGNPIINEVLAPLEEAVFVVEGVGRALRHMPELPVENRGEARFGLRSLKNMFRFHRSSARVA